MNNLKDSVMSSPVGSPGALNFIATYIVCGVSNLPPPLGLSVLLRTFISKGTFIARIFFSFS